MKLRPYQQAAINKFFSLPVPRLILAHATGAGKTRTALEIAKRLDVQRLLILGSAQSRATWPKEAEQWWPEATMASVRFGPTNKSLSAAQQAERDAAYEAKFRVSSFALMKHLGGEAPDLLIVDEAHALQSPTSQQSRLVRTYVHAYPKLPVLLLTATPAPNEIMGIYNLVDTIYPNMLGEPTKAGEVSWAFRNQYCQVKEGWQGTRVYYGSRPENMPRLANKLAPIMHRVSDLEVAAFAPPLNASILWVDEPKATDAGVAKDWLTGREAEGCTHVGLFAWTHNTAYNLAKQARAEGWPVMVITGSIAPEVRRTMLATAEAEPRMCIVGTAGSLAMSISLSLLKQALVFEWRATPGQALQFSGRFARQDSKSQAITYLKYVARPDDEGAAKVLRGRLAAASALYEQDSRAAALMDVMAPREMSEERLQAMADSMFSDTRPSLGGIIEEDDEDS